MCIVCDKIIKFKEGNWVSPLQLTDDEVSFQWACRNQKIRESMKKRDQYLVMMKSLDPFAQAFFDQINAMDDPEKFIDEIFRALRNEIPVVE